MAAVRRSNEGSGRSPTAPSCARSSSPRPGTGRWGHAVCSPTSSWAMGRTAESSSGHGSCRTARRSCSTACPPQSSSGSRISSPRRTARAGWWRGAARCPSARSGGGSERLLDVLEAEASVEPFGEGGVLVLDQAGNARLWSFGGAEPSRVWAIRRPAGATSALPDSAGRRVASVGADRQSIRVWELGGAARGEAPRASPQRPVVRPEPRLSPGRRLVRRDHPRREAADHVAARTALPQRCRGLRVSRATASRSPSALTAGGSRSVGRRGCGCCRCEAATPPQCGSFASRSNSSSSDLRFDARRALPPRRHHGRCLGRTARRRAAP